jgi:hypothetical protein
MSNRNVPVSKQIIAVDFDDTIAQTHARQIKLMKDLYGIELTL